MVSTPPPRDFLDLDCLAPAQVQGILALARQLKRNPLAFRPFAGKTLALVFEKPSTRTRVSFEVGMRQLGGEVTTLSGAEIQLGRGETIADTGRVLSRYVNLIMLRTFAEHKLHELADGASIPVINGLTDRTHPCQVMADLLTATERFGSLQGRHVAWFGDGDNNVLNSWLQAAPIFDFSLQIVCPPVFTVPVEVLIAAQTQGARVTVTADPLAATGADVVVTDCWVSMHNSDAAARHEQLRPYQVDTAVMGRAAAGAIFMHCLPAHRGEEVTDAVIDSPQSAVWDEAENRLHVQKAIMCWCLGVAPPEVPRQP